jgi:SAM-dependent methyltransferase
MRTKVDPDETRSLEQLRQHYEVECELANRLRQAPAKGRTGLYPLLYDELYRRVPLHPRLTRKADPQLSQRFIDQSIALLAGFLRPDSVYLEIGAGDCGFALHVAKQVKKAYAVEVSTEATRHVHAPSNMELIISDGKSIDIPRNSVTVAYSNQVMEHIHPDDALEHLRSIHETLAPGGAYICVTPNRLSGPHDISRYFDEFATGMHMREYTAGELANLLRDAGFSRTEIRMGVRRKYARSPLGAILAVEKTISAVPFPVRKRIVTLPGLRNCLRVAVIGFK